MKVKLIPFFLFFWAISVSALSLNADILKLKWNWVICQILCILLFISGAILALIIVLAGLKYMNLESPEERNEVKKRLLYAFLGLIIVLTATPLVNYLVENFSPEPEKFDCWCSTLSGNITNGGNYPLIVVIVYPGDGSVLENGSEIQFQGQVDPMTGKPPYTYEWSSSPAGLSRTVTKDDSFDSFTHPGLPRGSYTITLKVTDSEGKTGQDSVNIRIIVPKPKT